MIGTRARWQRWTALLGLMGALAIGLARPASAWEKVQFQQRIPVLDALLQSFDAYGSFWWVWGDFKLDTTWWMDDTGECWVFVSGLLNNRTLHYKSGYNHKMEAWFDKWVPCFRDPVDKTIQAKVEFPIRLRGVAGGFLKAKMRLMFTPTGAQVVGMRLEEVDSTVTQGPL
jgi:hypothetical protein